MATHDEHDIPFEDIQKLFLGQLSAPRSEQVRDHVRECQQCDGVFERLANAERALFKSEQGLTSAGFDRIQARLFQQPVKQPLLANVRMRMLGLTAVAAMGGVLFFFAPPSDDGYRSRGNGEQVSLQVGLRALRVREEGGKIDVQDALQNSLQPGDALKLLYSSKGGYQFVTVFAANDSLEMVLDSAPISHGIDQKLPNTLAVTTQWSSTPRLIAVFHNGRFQTPNADAVSHEGANQAVRVLQLTMGPKR